MQVNGTQIYDYAQQSGTYPEISHCQVNASVHQSILLAESTRDLAIRYIYPPLGTSYPRVVI